MVSGINFNNYSVAQLKEMKDNGVQGITDDTIKAAEEKEAQAAADKTADEAATKYEVTDDAAKTNEAQQEVETAKEYGANLKTILGTLMEKCQTKTSEMADLNKGIEQFQSQLDAVVTTSTDMAVTATNKATELLTLKDDTENVANTIKEKIAAKKEELDKKQSEFDALQTKQKNGTLSAEEATKMTTLSDEIKSTKDEINDLLQQRDQKSADGNKTIEELTNNLKDTQSKLKVSSEKAQELTSSMNNMSTQAQNANEYADVTIEKGTEASNISNKGDAKDAGFTKRSGFAFWKKTKGDVGAANNMGNQAIATGAELGNATKDVAEGVKNLANSSGIAISNESSINTLSKKVYADTSSLSELKDTSSGGTNSKIRNYASNQAIYNSIADNQKNGVATGADADKTDNRVFLKKQDKSENA